MLILVSVLGAVIIGCTTGPMSIPESRSAAAQLYVGKCSICHALPHPKRNSYPEWQHLLNVMQQRMAERGIPVLTGEEKKKLLDYLQQHAR